VDPVHGGGGQSKRRLDRHGHAVGPGADEGERAGLFDDRGHVLHPHPAARLAKEIAQPPDHLAGAGNLLAARRGTWAAGGALHRLPGDRPPSAISGREAQPRITVMMEAAIAIALNARPTGGRCASG